MSGLAAVGLVLTGLVVSASPAAAAGTCSLYVPSRVSIGQPYRAIAVRLGPNCTSAGVVDAAWSGYHPTQGLQAFLWYQNTTTEVWDLYALNPLGRMQWRPEGAFDNANNPVYQYGPYTTDIRLASYGRVSSTRSGSKVNVRTTAARYWQSGSRFIGWSGARGLIQWRKPGTSTWYGLKEVYSNSSGVYSYTYTTSAVRDYRVVLRDAPTIWGSISPAVRG